MTITFAFGIVGRKKCNSKLAVGGYTLLNKAKVNGCGI